MKTLCYYVSDYGYDHATRSVAVIRGMLETSAYKADLKIIVRSGKVLPFLRKSLQGYTQRLEFEPCFSDLGYVLKEGSMEADLEGLRRHYKRYLEVFPHMVAEEANFLQHRNADLIISDISPVPFVSAHLTGLPSIGISDFTWFTAYKDMLDERLLKPLYDAYSHMGAFIKLPGADEPDWNEVNFQKAGFISREPDQAEVERIQQQLNPNRDKTVILMNVGMGISLNDLQELSLWNRMDCVFVVSSNMKVTGCNIHPIPENYTESQNYVAAADLIVTRLGCGSLAEGVRLNKPLIILKENRFRGHDHTNHAIGISGVEVFDWSTFKHITLSPVNLRTSLLFETSGRITDHDPIHDITAYLDHLLDTADLKESQRSDAM